jgi:hypothetical protein
VISGSLLRYELARTRFCVRWFWFPPRFSSVRAADFPHIVFPLASLGRAAGHRFLPLADFLMFIFRSMVPARVDLYVSSEHPPVSAGFLVFHGISQGLFFDLELFLFFSGGCAIQSAQVLELQSKLFSICCRYFLPGLSLRCCVVIFLTFQLPASIPAAALICFAPRRSNWFWCAHKNASFLVVSHLPVLNFSARLLGFGQSCASVG